MSDVTRATVRANLSGVSLNAPVDDPRIAAAFKFPYLQNVRSYQSGRIETRPGFSKISTAAATAPVHSIRRLNNTQSQTWTRIIGAGTKLWYGATPALTNPASGPSTGYSGNPLALVPFQPLQAPDAWMYVGDSAQMAKIHIDGTTQTIGIAPP